MRQKLFDELSKSIREAGKIRRKERKASRVFRYKTRTQCFSHCADGLGIHGRVLNLITMAGIAKGSVPREYLP